MSVTENGPGVATALTHSDPIAPVIFGVTLILIAALIGRHLARRTNQPSVLGELLMGLLLGNVLAWSGYELMLVLREGTAVMDMTELAMAGADWESAAVSVLGSDAATNFLAMLKGPHGGEYLQVAHAVDVLSRYGVIFLLFHVGLETSLAELRNVGGDSIRVAVLGVAAPFALGFLASWLLSSAGNHEQHLYLGATLGATSIGITARVLQDINRSQSGEARIILGAAVIDDILGLVMLAIVTGIVVTGTLQLGEVAQTIALATLFIGAALALGPYVIRFLVCLLKRFDEVEAKIFISFVFVMTLAWAASSVGLATIIGAFAAGVLVTDDQFHPWNCENCRKYSIRELFMPIEAILVPIFFVLMGMQVKLEAFFDPDVLLLSAALILAAAIGKLVSGLGVRQKGLRRLVVGVGMLPRGEVGLVFASIGRSLGVVSTEIFSAIVLMVIVTTFATPPWLKALFANESPAGDVEPVRVEADD
ncbi:MAG: cation:proton antiporter [Gammaproteobacteria bacterium]|nr:cation:proton antiporter [Gammaproteobacteria bacterium]